MKKNNQTTLLFTSAVLLVATVLGPISASAQTADYLALGQYFSAIQKTLCEESNEQAVLDSLRGQEIGLYSRPFSSYVNGTDAETKTMVRQFRVSISSMRSSLETKALGGNVHRPEDVKNEFCAMKFE